MFGDFVLSSIPGFFSIAIDAHLSVTFKVWHGSELHLQLRMPKALTVYMFIYFYLDFS
jgi:hypothetical protein